MKTTCFLAVLLLSTAVAEGQWTTGTMGRIYYNGGFVGVGTTTPREHLDMVSASDSAFFAQTSNTAGFAYGRFIIPANSTVNNVAAGFFFQEGVGDNSAGNRFWAFGFNPVLDNFTIIGGNAFTNRLSILANGNVGINQSNPQQILDVNGNVNVVGNIAAKYQDVAEWVNANESLGPGTVVVLNPDKSNQVMASLHPYDTGVAGVVSSKPGLILGEAADDKEKIATSGRVKVRVDASMGAIHIGDLLVTGEKPGTAMKSQPVNVAGVKMHRPGTIVGKALEPLAKGEGEILVLLSLQ